MKIKVTPLFPLALYCMGGRTKIGFWKKKERYWKKKIDFRNQFLCV